MALMDSEIPFTTVPFEPSDVGRPIGRMIIYARGVLDADGIALVQKGARALPCKSGNTSTGQGRNSDITWLKRNDYPFLHRRVDNVATKLPGTRIKHQKECLQHSLYGEGMHYTWHRDADPPYNGIVRTWSMSLLLSPADEGGLLEFREGDGVKLAEEIPGDAVFFPSSYYHQVTPVTKGARESLVLWWVGYPHEIMDAARRSAQRSA